MSHIYKVPYERSRPTRHLIIYTIPNFDDRYLIFFSPYNATLSFKVIIKYVVLKNDSLSIVEDLYYVEMIREGLHLLFNLFLEICQRDVLHHYAIEKEN